MMARHGWPRQIGELLQLDEFVGKAVRRVTAGFCLSRRRRQDPESLPAEVERDNRDSAAQDFNPMPGSPHTDKSALPISSPLWRRML